MKTGFFISTIIAFIFTTVSSFGQITVAPTNLFIDDNARFGTYLVINNSDVPQEVSIDFFFSYIESDDKGNTAFITDNTEVESQYSISDQVRAFPRDFVLQPNQRQVVRLRLMADNNLSDGLYWSRIRTRSSPESPPLEISEDESVSAQVGIVINQVTGLFYKKGSTNTNIEVEEIRSEINDEQLTIMADIKRGGNSPFFGTVTTKLYDEQRNIIAQDFKITSIYFDGVFRQEFLMSNLQSGEYEVEINFEASRNDIPDQNLIPMPAPVTAKSTVTIP